MSSAWINIGNGKGSYLLSYLLTSSSSSDLHASFLTSFRQLSFKTAICYSALRAISGFIINFVVGIRKIKIQTLSHSSIKVVDSFATYI